MAKKEVESVDNLPQSLGRRSGAREESWVSSTFLFLSLQEGRERELKEDDGDGDDEGEDVRGWICEEIQREDDGLLRYERVEDF